MSRTNYLANSRNTTEKISVAMFQIHQHSGVKNLCFSLNKMLWNNLIDNFWILFPSSISIGNRRSMRLYKAWEKHLLIGVRVNKWKFHSKLRELIDLITRGGIFKAKWFLCNLDRPYFGVKLFCIAEGLFSNWLLVVWTSVCVHCLKNTIFVYFEVYR